MKICEQNKLNGDEQMHSRGSKARFLMALLGEPNGDGLGEHDSDRIHERGGDWQCRFDVERLGGCHGGLAAVTSGTTSSTGCETVALAHGEGDNQEESKAHLPSQHPSWPGGGHAPIARGQCGGYLENTSLGSTRKRESEKSQQRVWSKNHLSTGSACRSESTRWF